MKRRAILSLLIAATGWRAAAAADGGLKVIANPSVRVAQISGHDLKSIFLGSATALKNSGPVRPVLNRGQDHLEKFSSQYLGKSSHALETYYRSLIFTGRWAMPASFEDDQAVIDFVARTPGAIGFVSEGAPPGKFVTLRVVQAAR